MENTPKSLRLHLTIAGRINAGKSSLLNLISGQNTAITSPERGTTTDVVEKTMELRPVGPVVFLDTAGIDDFSELGDLRTEKTIKAVDRAETVILVLRNNEWGEPEKQIAGLVKKRNIPLLGVINIFPGETLSEEYFEVVKNNTGTTPVTVNALNFTQRDVFLNELTSSLIKLIPDALISPTLLDGVLKEDALVLLMVPLDIQAPKGRLIMPQIQTIRDALDRNANVVIGKESAFPEVYSKLAVAPDLVICDSQAVDLMTRTIPPGVSHTTFSILMARMKGDLTTFAKGCAAIEKLRPGDKILIAEACTHHASDDDIGRKKIPALLEKKAGGKLHFDIASGADYPQDLASYALIVHCGGCMLNRRAMLNRQQDAISAGVPITNYGMCISACKGVVRSVLSPFDDALKEYVKELDK